MKNNYLSKNHSKNKNQGISFAGEIFEMSPLIWFILTLVAIGIFIMGKLGFWLPISNTVSLWTLNTKTSIYQFSENWQSFWDNLENLSQTQLKLQELTAEKTELESRLAQVELVFNENEKLQAETGLKFSRNYSQIGVEVLGVDIGKKGIVKINKGESDGIKLGDVAAIEKILLGKVTKLNNYTAEVTLVESTNITLPVKLADRNLGVLSATESGGLKVQKILQSTKVNLGDKVFSSGINSEYPPDLYIGEVINLTNDPRASTKEAQIQSPIDFSHLNKFKIIQLPQ